LRITEIDLDVGRQCESLVTGHLCTPVPGQRFVEFVRQLARVLEMVLYVLVPSFAPYLGGRALLQDPRHMLGRVVWSAAGFGLSGSLAVAVYMRFRSSQFAREMFNAAELERVEVSRAVLASQLAALQARVEPRFLLSTLAQVEALYDRDPEAGDRMLDGLIAYLHAALPQLRSQRSTLKQEVQLAESYLRIVQIRMGSRLGWRLDVEPGLDNYDFPPMMLLPLIDEALRNGLEPLPHGGTITLAAEADRDRLRLRISDDGLQRDASSSNGLTMAALCDRLDGLYGGTGRFGSTFNAAQGVVTTIEVPLAAACINR
jgi:hypothetical protein